LLSGSLVDSGHAWYGLDGVYEVVGCNKRLTACKEKDFVPVVLGMGDLITSGTGRRRFVDMRTETKEL
jgi:hypothetical protein